MEKSAETKQFFNKQRILSNLENHLNRDNTEKEKSETVYSQELLLSMLLKAHMLTTPPSFQNETSPLVQTSPSKPLVLTQVTSAFPKLVVLSKCVDQAGS